MQATEFGKRADPRTSTIATRGPSWYDLTAAEGIRSGKFVLDYLADTGDGFDATYAMARALTGTLFPVSEAASSLPGGRGDLLLLGGDEVYPTGTVQSYDRRLKNVFDVADSTRGGYVAAIPGNHDYYADGLNPFLDNFASRYSEDGYVNTPPCVVPQPNKDVILGRYPMQSRSYFAIKLPHNWWLWGIDIALDAQIDAEQKNYFKDFARPLVEEHHRVILCTARPSWQDPEEPDLGYHSNRQRLAWFVNLMFGNDEGPDPATDELAPDWVGHVPVLLSGDKHHYARYSRTAARATDTASAPMHLVTCGGGGAYLSSTHHLKDDIAMSWHLDEAEPQGYTLKVAYPDKETSRGELSRKLWRIPVVNKLATPLLVVTVVALIAGAFVAVRRDQNPATWAALGVAVVLPLAATLLLAKAFSPRSYTRRRTLLTWPMLGLGHTAAYAVAAAISVWVAAGVDRLGAGLGLPAALALPDEAAASSLWDGRPLAPLIAGSVTLVLTALIAFASYWWFADRVGWHENEFFSGMGLDGYKSFVRIVISPPEGVDTAGALTATVWGVRNVPRNRRSTAPLTDPELELVDAWSI